MHWTVRHLEVDLIHPMSGKFPRDLSTNCTGAGKKMEINGNLLNAEY